PHDVHPDPTGPPADRHDDAWHDYDGPADWPADWPGRWQTDPAITAARGTTSGGTGHNGQRVVCGTCRQPASPAPLPALRRGVIELQIPLTTALGLDNLPGELNGNHPILAELARHLITQMPDAQWRYSVYTPQPHQLVAHGILNSHPTPDLDGDPDRRRPTAAQAAFVRARDPTCRAPGCRRPAHTCDIDHTQPWANGGKTTTSNLGCLCRAHHLFRHTTGTQLTQLSPGVFSWQTPHGLQYLVRQDPPLLSLNQPQL
ncbi:MAG TPA: HNH endonuclease signature motif containing protein, partial [Natronosporangium sp.]